MHICSVYSTRSFVGNAARSLCQNWLKACSFQTRYIPNQHVNFACLSHFVPSILVARLGANLCAPSVFCHFITFTHSLTVLPFFRRSFSLQAFVTEWLLFVAFFARWRRKHLAGGFFLSSVSWHLKNATIKMIELAQTLCPFLVSSLKTKWKQVWICSSTRKCLNFGWRALYLCDSPKCYK